MPTEEELFAAVDALLEGDPQLPPPAERARLREAAGVTQARLAQALRSTTQTIKNWENGRSQPRPPRLQAYVRLLAGWAAQHPGTGGPAADVPGALSCEPPAANHGGAPEPPGGRHIARPSPAETPGQEGATGTSVPPRPAEGKTTHAADCSAVGSAGGSPHRSTASSKPAAPRAARPAYDPRFPHGSLAALDGDGTAYTPTGVLLDCPATTIPELVRWTLAESGLGAARLHRCGKDADPLIVLTAAAAERFGLPPRLEDRQGLRLPEDHTVVKQITRADWKLTKRGFGPWARVYRPAQGGRRQCVQLAVLPWDALDCRAWPGADQLPAADLAHVLGTYAARVITPCGSTAVCGLELMTALRPPTRASRGGAGEWTSAPNPGALTGPVDPAPPEAPREHPVAQGWERGFLDEEAYQWVRDPGLLTDDECLLPHAVGIDINTAFLAAAARLTVGRGGPRHITAATFDKKVPGAWLVDLSHIDLDPRLPSPFTPSGQPPRGPAWYATPTVAYARELGYDVRPIEAYVRMETGAYLDPWHDRLKDAYVTMLAELGVPTGKDADPAAYLRAMARHKALAAAGEQDLDAARQAHPDLARLDDDRLADAIRRHRHGATVLSAIKSTVKGGIGKLREKPQGRHYRDGERWPALERPTWRPDIRAAVISKARVNMHRKMAKLAAVAGLYPLGVLSDCVVYPSPGPSPLDFLPRGADGQPVAGTFRLGAGPGLSKPEGVQEMAWAVDLMEQGYNPARHIKGGDAVLDGE